MSIERRGPDGRHEHDLGVAERRVVRPRRRANDCGSRSVISTVPRSGPESEIERSVSRSRGRVADPGDLFPAHEHRVGEREGIDHHDAGRHENEEPPREGMQRTDHRECQPAPRTR